MVRNLKFILIIVIFLAGFISGTIFDITQAGRNSAQPKVDNKVESSQSGDISNIWMDLPLDYFSKNDVQWGSAGNGNGDKITDYTQAAIKNMAVYQSYPATITTIQSYSNEEIDLKLLSPSETQKKISEMQTGQNKAEDSYKEFGVLVSHFLPEEYIYSVKKFDVDGDGQSESIVGHTQTFAAGFGSYTTDVIKGNKIIFSVTEDNASIIPADTSNGFFVEWGSVGELNGRCCEEGIKRTRFVFKDGEFKPLYEQEVRYLKIGKE